MNVVVVGGGISGLSLCWFLRNVKGIQVHLVEKAAKVGGWCTTDRNLVGKSNHSYLFENGPRGFRSDGKGIESLKLVEELGLDKFILPTAKEAMRKCIYVDGQVRKLPNGIHEALAWPNSLKIGAGVVKERFTNGRYLGNEETIFEFIQRRFNRTIAEELVDPVISGIFAGDIRRLSMKAALPTLWELEEKYGSVVKGMMEMRKLGKRKTLDGMECSEFVKSHEHSGGVSFVDGMQTLPNTLMEKLQELENVTVHCNTIVEGWSRKENGKILINTENKDIVADHVFSTIPSQDLAKVVKNAMVNEHLQDIPKEFMAIARFGYTKQVLNEKAVGYLVPSNAKQSILGVTFDSQVYPGQNKQAEETRISVMIGGTHMPWAVKASKHKIMDVAKRATVDHLGIMQKPDVEDCLLIENAIPQYVIGHQKKVHEIEMQLKKKFPNMDLLGNHFKGVGVSDCISNAKSIALAFEKKCI